MPAANYDIVIPKGASLKEAFVWNDSNGDPIPLTGFDAKMQIRQRLEDVAPVIELTPGNSRIVLEANSEVGRVDLYLPLADTNTLGITAGRYDLLLWPSGDTEDVTWLLQGLITVQQTVTR